MLLRGLQFVVVSWQLNLFFFVMKPSGNSGDMIAIQEYVIIIKNSMQNDKLPNMVAVDCRASILQFAQSNNKAIQPLKNDNKVEEIT